VLHSRNANDTLLLPIASSKPVGSLYLHKIQKEQRFSEKVFSTNQSFQRNFECFVWLKKESLKFVDWIIFFG